LTAFPFTIVFMQKGKPMDNIPYKKIVEIINDGLYVVSKDRVITYWNQAAERITGFHADEVVGKSCADDILTHVDDQGLNLCCGLCPLAATIADGEPRQTSVYLHHKDGQRIPVAVRAGRLVDEQGMVIGGVELFTDMSSNAANELRVKELEKLALLDTLTQMANRHYLETELEGRYQEKKRHNLPFGLLFMDIDNFKLFNDTYGHEVGDMVLKLVSRTMIANARPFDLYGRWGGEEFVAIIRNVTTDELEVLGNRMRLLIEKSCLTHARQKHSVTISIGATLAREEDTPASLVKRADALLYQSKAVGKNRVTTG
jgi:diguanylate cyclase (GGDEF)-like protein/PAS domain S-box-containing protein